LLGVTQTAAKPPSSSCGSDQVPTIEREEAVYLIDFLFDGQMVRAQAAFVGGDEILIGTQMLRHHRLQIDFPAKVVAIQRA